MAKKKKVQDTSPLAMGRQQKGSAAYKKEQKAGTKTKSQSSVSSKKTSKPISSGFTVGYRSPKANANNTSRSTSTSRNVTSQDRINQKNYGATRRGTTPTATSRQRNTPATSAEMRRQNAAANNNLKQTQAERSRNEQKQRFNTAKEMMSARRQTNEQAKAQNAKEWEGVKNTSKEEQQAWFTKKAQEAQQRRTGKVEKGTDNLATSAAKSAFHGAKGAVHSLYGALTRASIQDEYDTQRDKALAALRGESNLDQVEKEAREKAQDRKELKLKGIRAKTLLEQQKVEELKEQEAAKDKGPIPLRKMAVGAASFTGQRVVDTALLGPYSLASMGARVLEDERNAGQEKNERLKKRLAESGQFTQEELDEEFKRMDRRSVANAYASSGIEILSELMFGGIGLSKKYMPEGTRGILDKTVGKLFGNIGKTAAGRLGLGIAEETAEEWIANPVQARVSNMLTGNRLQSLQEESVRREYQKQTMDLKEMQATSADINSDAFLERAKEIYKESGATDKEASKIAELARDYFNADIIGDSDTAEAKLSEITNILAGGENDLREKWTLKDALEVAGEMILSVGAEGFAGAISSSAAGNEYKGKYGVEGVRKLAKVVENLDADKSDRAKAIIDDIDNGKDITGTQVSQIMEWSNETALKAQDREITRDNLVQNRMKDEKLFVPIVDSEYNLSPATDARFEEISDRVVDNIDNMGIKMSDVDAYAIADVVAAYETGTISAEQMNELNVENPEARAVFERETGINLDQYTVKDKRGNIKVAESNIKMQKALFSNAADNYMASARIEQENWNNVERGRAAESLTSDMDGMGGVGIQRVLESVDPRNRGDFMLAGSVARRVYDHARLTNDSWEDVRKDFKNAFPGASMDESMRYVYDMAKRTKTIAETQYYGKQVSNKQSLADSETMYVPGNFTNNSERMLGNTELSTLTNMATTLGVNIVMSDNMANKNANGSYDSSTRTITLNADKSMGEMLQFVLAHEVTHHLAAYAPDEYLKLSRFVMDKAYKADAEKFETAIKNIQKKYKDQAKQDLTPEQALEEIIADNAHEFWQDEAFINDVTSEEPTLAQSIINAIKDILNKLRSVLASGNITDENDRQFLFDEIDSYDQTYKLWMNAFRVARDSQANQAINDWQDEVNAETSLADVEASERFSISEQQDSDYMSAVESGDMETAQRMVDEAAMAAGYTMTAYRGGKANVFEKEREGVSQVGTFFTSAEYIANAFAGGKRENVGAYYLKIDNPLTLDAEGRSYVDIPVPDNHPDKDLVAYAKDTFDGTISADDMGAWADEHGYDGVIINNVKEGIGGDAETDLIVINPEQTKSADPVTYDDDGNVIPLSERFNQENPDVRFSISAPVERVKDLVAVHNLTEGKLRGDFRLGGFPMPSIAVTNQNHENFGDISLLFGSDTIDPKKNSANKVYSADAWTPTVPVTEYEADYDVASKVMRTVKELVEGSGVPTQGMSSDLHPDNIQDSLRNESGFDGFISRIMNKPYIKYAFLKSQGEDIEVPYKEGSLQGHGKAVWEKIDAAIPEMTRSEAYNMDYDEAMKLEPIIRNIVAEDWINLKSSMGIDEEKARNLNPYKNEWAWGKVTNYLADLVKFRESGKDIQVVDEKALEDALDEKINKDAYREWTSELFDGIIKDSGVRNQADPFTPSGNRRSFKATHHPATLDGILKAMKEQGEKNVSWHTSTKTLRADTAKTFKSLDEIRDEKGKLKNLSEEDVENIYKELDDKFYEILNNIGEQSSREYDLYAADIIADVMSECAQAGYTSPEQIIKHFGNYEWTVTEQDAEDILALFDAIQNMPVNMFEAKPRRAVGFNEVKAAIVPADTSEDILNELELMEIPVTKYNKEVEGDRAAKLNEVADAEQLKFSISEDIMNTLEDNFNEYKEDKANLRIATEAIADLRGVSVTGENLSGQRWSLDETASQRRVDNRADSGISSARTIAKGITSSLVNEGYIDFIGQKVESPEDLAKLGQVLRDPRFETFRLILTKGNKIVSFQSCSARMPGLSPVHNEASDAVFYEKSKEQMNKLGADGYYLMHNHPSGDVTASEDDRRVTANAIFKLGSEAFKGHVILDHDKFGLISNVDALSTPGSVSLTNMEAPIYGQQTIDLIHEPEIDHPLLGEKANNGEIVASIGEKVNTSNDYSVVIYVSSKLEVRGIQEVSNKEIEKDLGKFKSFIREQGVEFGSVSAFLYSPSGSDVSFSTIENLFEESVILDAVYGDTHFFDLGLERHGDPSVMGRSKDEINSRITVYESVAGTQDYNSIRYSITPKMDADYMAAVKSKNINDILHDVGMEEVHELVDKAAKAAGYNEYVFHGTGGEFTEFDESKSGANHGNWSKYGKGFYFSDSEDTANYWGNNRKMIKAYIKLKNPYIITGLEMTSEGPLFEAFNKLRRRQRLTTREEELDDYMISYLNEKYGKDYTTNLLKEHGYDGIIVEHPEAEGRYSAAPWSGTIEYIVFDAENIKSAEAVTFDDDLTIIPLSERFNPENKDIRYSLPTTDADGKVLSDGQLDYFKNSMARDREGKLVPVFHSTSNGGFSIFDPSYSDDKRSIFFTSNRQMSKSYIRGYGKDFEATTFGLPAIEWDDIENLSDVAHYFRKLNEAPGEKQDLLGIRIRVPGTINEDGFAESYASWGEESWSYDDTLNDLINKYGEDYKNIEGEFIDEDGAIIGEFSDWQDLVNEFLDCVKYVNDQIGTEGKGQTGTYQCYLNLENPMIIDCKGRNWDSIIGDGFEELFISYDGESFYVDGTTIPWTLDEIRDQYGDGFADAAEEWIETAPEDDLEMGDKVYTWEGAAFNPEEEGYWPSEENTRYWCLEAEAQGYDGVIFLNLMDNGPHGYGDEIGDVYVAFSSNQIKDIYNLNPTENPDIRYSFTDEDEAKSKIAYDDAIDNSFEALEYYEQRLADLTDEAAENRPIKRFNEDRINEFYAGLKADDSVPYSDYVLEEDRVRMAKSKNDYFNNINAKWNDRWTTDGEVLNVKSVKTDVRNLIMGVMSNSDTDSQYKRELVNKTLFDIRTAYQLMKQDRPEVASALLYHSAQRMIDNVEFYVDGTFDQYKELKDYLRTTRISIGEEYWADVEYDAFRKRNFGRMKLVKGRTNVDQIYQQLEEMFPEWFNEEEAMDVPSQLLQIEHVLDSVQPYKEAYSSEAAAELAFDIADDLYEIMVNGDEVRSLADTYKQRYDEKTKAMKQRHAEAMLRMRKARDIGILQEKAKWRARDEARKERQDHSKHFSNIQKNYNWLKERLLTNTKDKHIPEQYKKELAGLLAAFDLQTVGSKKLEAKRGYQAQKTIQMSAIRTGLNAMHEAYPTFYVHDSITDKIDALAKSVDGKTIDALTVGQLQEIDDILKGLKSDFINYDRVMVKGKKMAAADAGKAEIKTALDHVEEFGAAKDFQNLPGVIDKLINLDEMTAPYLFRRIDPDNTGLGMMYGEIRRGFDKYVRNQSKLNDWMEEIVGKYHQKGILWNKYGSGELSDWRSDTHAKTFNFEGGPLRLTPAQMMSLYCLSKRPQAMNHILQGGVVAAPVSFNAKMLSDIKGKVNKAVPTYLTGDDIKQIVAELTPEQIQVATQLQELMSTKMAEWGNEASMDVMDIELFKEKEYFPIKSDQATLTKDLNDSEFVQAVRNFGFTKALTPNAGNTIVIDDIFDVVAEHCNNMNLYNAYSKAFDDFMKVYNYKDYGEDGTGYTVQQAVAHAYSQKATTFIMTLLRDLNGNVSGRASGVEDAYNTMLGNAKKAAVFANFRVAAQQPTAITRAFYVIDPKYLKGVKIEKGAMVEMFEHCPIALWKSWGYYDINMGKSIEDIMMNNGRWLEDKATDLYGALDNVTWTAIWQMVKNEMKDTHPDVEIGTDEYWDLCNERMSEVVDLTQVVDSPLHRSHGMRSKNFLVKTATAFMAEPTLTFNMLRDGYIRSAEARRRGKILLAGQIASRVIAVGLLQAVTVAGASGLVDALRGKNPDKDDDDERFLHLWWVNFIENFKDELKIWNKIYVVKDIASQLEGWDNANLALQGLQKFSLGWRQVKGDPYARSSVSWYENMADGLGYMFGVPVKTMRTGIKNAMDFFGIEMPEGAASYFEHLDDIAKDNKKKKQSESKGEATSVINVSSVSHWYDYENNPITVKDGSTFDRLLNHFGINLTKAEKAAVLRSQEEKEFEQKREEIKESVLDYTGEEKAKKTWSKVTTYLKEKEGKSVNELVESGDFATLSKYRTMFLAAGNNEDYFDSRIYDASKKALKKSIVYDATDSQINAQENIKDYLLSHGMTEAEMSDIAYRSDTARDMKVAFRLGDKELMMESLEPLVNAGLTYEDLERLWKNRNRVDLKRYDGRYKDQLKSTGNYQFPVSGTITITSDFGNRNSPGGIGSTNHKGLDIASSAGTPIAAADGGTVVYSGWDGGLGKCVRIQHDDGTITEYGHLSWWDVNVGDTVGQGQEIGLMGSTGNSTGPHLHFGVLKNGEYVDPKGYIETADKHWDTSA